MRDLPRRSLAAGADRGQWVNGGAVALLVGAVFGLGHPSARAQESAAPAASPPAAVAAPGGAAPASGAGESQLDEVIVTARKRSETIQDIPATVQAISASTIVENHMTQLDDIGSLVTNLNIFEAHDNSPAVVMRGVGSFEQVVGVGFYMNDVQLFEGQTARPMDIERIEILKGPQGTLYGGANIGGAIKYVTKDPTPTWQNEVTAEVGNYRQANVSAVISGPIADKLGMRVSLYSDNSEGYIWDTYQNKTIGETHDRGGRVVFLAEPQSTTSVRFALNAEGYDSQNQNLQYKVNQFDAPLLPYTADNYRYSVDDFFNPSFTRKTESATLAVDHQFDNGMTFNSITAQYWSYNRGITDFTKKPKPLDLLFQNLDQRVVSQEFRLASTAHSNLDWLVGVFAQQHKLDTTNSDLNFEGSIPATYTTWAADQQLPQDYDIQNKVQKQFAVFGDATYYVGDWQFELGLRAENYHSNLKAQNQPSTGAGPLPPTLVTLAPQDLTGNKISPKASIQYKYSAGTNFYGTVARGFQPSDLQEQFVNGAPAITPVLAETTTSYELGVKSRLQHGIQLNAAVFYMDYKDRLYQSMVATGAGFQDIVHNIGPSRNSGVEVEFLMPLTTELRLSGGIGTTRAVWGNAQYSDPQLNVAAGNPATPIFRNLNGMTAPFTPAYSANLALDWNRVLGNGYKVGARLDGQAIGQSYWDPNDMARQKAYQLLNAGAHMDAGNWTWIAHVTNLTGTQFNTMYWDATDVGVPDNHSFARINRPRTYAFSGTYRF